MQYITVDEKEAVDQEKGTLKDGYQKWAYVYKRVIPDTPEEIAAQEKIPKARVVLKALIALMNPDPTKVKLEEVVAHLIQMQIIMGLR